MQNNQKHTGFRLCAFSFVILSISVILRERPISVILSERPISVILSERSESKDPHRPSAYPLSKRQRIS